VRRDAHLLSTIRRGFNAGSSLEDKTPWSDSVLPDLTSTRRPGSSTDFNQPAPALARFASANLAKDPACLRKSRHDWCNYEQTTVGDPDAKVNDGRKGDRGSRPRA